MSKEKVRCAWVTKEKIYEDYHDLEWGVPVHDDNKLFEILMLECMQAGLSWLIVLRKRDAMRIAFDNFDIDKIIEYDSSKVNSLMENENIIRNRAKILGIISNAKAFKEIQKSYGSFDRYLWDHVEHKPVINLWGHISDVPTSTELSKRISKDLKRLGFKFLGEVTVYAYLQAVGVINDHTKDCFKSQNN